MKKLIAVTATVLMLAMLSGACAPSILKPVEKQESEMDIYNIDLNAKPAPIKSKSGIPGNYAYWLDLSKSLIQNGDPEADVFYSRSADSSNYAWGTSYVAQGLYTAYCVTGDIAYLETYALVCSGMLDVFKDSDNDGYNGYGTSGYAVDKKKYEEFAVHSGLVVKIFADFAVLVKSNPELENKKTGTGETYGALAARVVAAANDHIIPSFEKDFSKQLNIYMNRPGSGNYSGSTIEMSLPHNQYLSMCIGLYTMAFVSPENTVRYNRRADQLAESYYSFIKKNDDGTITWNYDDAFFDTDHSTISIEDYSHAIHEYRAAIQSYSSGGIFTLDELKRYAENLQTRMFNGDYENPRVSGTVTGGEDKSGFADVPYIYNILLALYGDEVWQICAKATMQNPRSTDAPLLLALHPEAPAPEKFSLTLPEENAKPDGSTVLFMWQPSKNASDYCLQISEDKDFTKLVVDRPYIFELAATVETLEPKTQYYWRVISHNQAGLTFTSDIRRFTTPKKEKTVKNILNFKYKTQIPSDATVKHTMQVYVNRRLVYESEPLATTDWSKFAIDLSGETAGYETASVRVALYREKDWTEEAMIYLDEIEMSASPDPKIDFTGDTKFYMFTTPDYYFNLADFGMREDCGVNGGAGFMLRLPPTTDEPFSESHIDVGFNLK